MSKRFDSAVALTKIYAKMYHDEFLQRIQLDEDYVRMLEDAIFNMLGVPEETYSPENLDGFCRDSVSFKLSDITPDDDDASISNVLAYIEQDGLNARRRKNFKNNEVKNG